MYNFQHGDILLYSPTVVKFKSEYYTLNELNLLDLKQDENTQLNKYIH